MINRSVKIELSPRRWMPASAYPAATRPDDRRVVHLQRHDGGATGGRKSHDRGACLVPNKVVRPSLLQGMEERHCETSKRIGSHLARVFVNIARETRLTEIVYCRRSTVGYRDNVIHVQFQTTVSFTGEAIRATISVALGNLGSQGGNDRHRSIFRRWLCED